MFVEYQASKLLSRYVRAYMILEVDQLPEGKFLAPAIARMGMVCSLENNVKITTYREETDYPESITLKGIYEFPYQFEYTGTNIRSYAVDFSPIGLHMLTGKECAMFTNRFVDAYHIFPSDQVVSLYDDLNVAVEHNEVCQLLDTFLLKKLEGKTIPTHVTLVESAIAFSASKKHQLLVDEIAESLCVSTKTLVRAFKKVIGITPKKYFAIALFENIIRQTVMGSDKSSMKDLLESPFYDYSHINKWFKKYANSAPSEFVNFDMHSVAEVIKQT